LILLDAPIAITGISRAEIDHVILGEAADGLEQGPLKDHPTAMLEDALLDLSNRNDIVVDPLLGLGSTLIAADKTDRVCRGVEPDPLHFDVIMRR
jgi:DNA modification methylase